MFSDVIVEHSGGAGGDPSSSLGQPTQTANVNVCWNEKTTQTDDSASRGRSTSPVTTMAVIMPDASTPLPLHRKASSSLKRRQSSAIAVPSYAAPGPGPGASSVASLTCQELLALSGALGAALPTPLALPSTDLPSSTAAPGASSGKPHNNNNTPGHVLLPTLAMALWPDPSSNPPPGRVSTCL